MIPDSKDKAYKCSAEFYFRLNPEELVKSTIYFHTTSPEMAAALFCTEYNNPKPGTYDVEVEDIVTREKFRFSVKTTKSWEIIS